MSPRWTWESQVFAAPARFIITCQFHGWYNTRYAEKKES
jgi:hypothetical protein